MELSGPNLELNKKKQWWYQLPKVIGLKFWHYKVEIQYINLCKGWMWLKRRPSCEICKQNWFAEFEFRSFVGGVTALPRNEKQQNRNHILVKNNMTHRQTSSPASYYSWWVRKQNFPLFSEFHYFHRYYDGRFDLILSHIFDWDQVVRYAWDFSTVLVQICLEYKVDSGS